MQALPPLTGLGRRIMILGPTNSGKSTLAVAIGSKLEIPAVHLDLMRHLPDSDWQQRSDAEFKALHDAALLGEAWVMDGNYSALMPPRIARTTAIIVLDDSLATRARRYFIRTLLQKSRAGGLPGQKDSIKWTMIHWLWRTRNTTEKYRQVARDSGLPYVLVRSTRDLRELYDAWGLERS